MKKALTAQQYAAAGLDKLSAEERAKLDEYLRGYFTGATQQVVQRAVEKASAQAVDQAVKEHRAEPPQLIESHIIGSVDGWRSGQIFVLENGQHWKVTDNEHHYFAPVVNPDVFIVRADIFGYKMAIAGGGTVRVIRTK